MTLSLPKPSVGSIPKISAGRDAEPNPFDAIVAELNGKRESALHFPFPYRNESDVKEVRRAKNAAQRAGKPLNVSVRTRVTVNDKDKTADLAVWVVDKITRKPADKADESKPAPAKVSRK